MLATVAVLLAGIVLCANAAYNQATCKDKASNCAQVSSFCARLQAFRDICPVTCGTCPPSGSGGKPFTQAPIRPATQAPFKPVTQAPPRPVTQAPFKPVTQAPPRPVTQAPQPPPQQGNGPRCPGGKMTTELRAAILNKHNELRSRLALGREQISSGRMAPGAKNMYKLSYDCELEKAAQRWVDTCPDRSVKAHSGADGENMYFGWSSGILTPAEMVESSTRRWWGELQQKGMRDANFRFTSAVVSSGVGHFTAMAWGRTTRLGCATASHCRSKGMNMGVLCCQYLEAGNMRNAPIYEIGKACTRDADCTTRSGSRCEAATGLCVAP